MDVIHFWLKYPKAYDAIQYLATGGFMSVVSQELKSMRGKRVLDLGCGTGGLIDYVKPARYVGWDINRDNIALARRKYSAGAYQFRVGDIVKDPLPKEHFDYAITINVLHHLSEAQVKAYFKRVAKWGKTKQFILVESKPTGLIGSFLGRLDAGDNFREHGVYLEWLSKYFKIKESTTVYAPWRTYKYLVVKLVQKK